MATKTAQSKKAARPGRTRFRVDAVVLTLFAAGVLLTTAVVSYRPIAGAASLFGALGDDVAALLVDPFGWAVLVFLAGWFVLTGLLVVNRSPARIGFRFAGWAVLTTCAATAIDWFGAALPPPSVAGRGGSVGAYLRFALEDSLDPLAATCTFTVIVIVGLVLAADWLVIGCLRGVGRTIRTMWRAAVWGNDRVADGSEKVILGLGTAAKAVSHGATGLARVAKAAIPSVPAHKVVSVSADTPTPTGSPLALAPNPPITTTSRFTFTPNTCRRR